MYKRQAGKKPKRYGGEVAVMKALAEVMNFTINFVEPPLGRQIFILFTFQVSSSTMSQQSPS